MAMLSYDLYGMEVGSLVEAVSLVSRALGLRFEPHDSSYIGDYFLAETAEGESFKLRENVDPMDGEPAEAEFPDPPFLLLVEGTGRSAELYARLTERISGIAHLRHEEL